VVLCPDVAPCRRVCLDGTARHRSTVLRLGRNSPFTSRCDPGGVYEITKQLPENRGEFEYRVKSVNELHERVARESELTKA
jgi:hypothetical protein